MRTRNFSHKASMFPAGFAILFLVVGSVSASKMQCYSESNDEVDWWFTYKQPNGFTFAYKDAEDSSSSPLSIAKGLLNSTNEGSLGGTLHQIYTHKSTYAYILWNDEWPDSYPTPPSGPSAHSKGIIATDGTTGFLMVHSVPKFPDLTAALFTWTASTVYGQSFLCISLSAETLDKIAAQYQYGSILAFASNMPSSLESKLPGLAGLIKGEQQSGSSYTPITSLGGMDFTAFMKSPDWGQDLAEDLVSPKLGVSMRWETWRRSPAMDTYCSPSYKYDEMNIQVIDFSASGGEVFKYTKDHCKWGISSTSSSPWVCVGDINRMTSQRGRGGGTVCTKNSALWSSLNGVVSSADSCSKTGMPILADEDPVPEENGAFDAMLQAQAHGTVSDEAHIFDLDDTFDRHNDSVPVLV